MKTDGWLDDKSVGINRSALGVAVHENLLNVTVYADMKNRIQGSKLCRSSTVNVFKAVFSVNGIASQNALQRFF